MKIQSFKTLDDDSSPVDLDAPIGTTLALTSSSTVTIIDQFHEYITVLKSCFDFDKLRTFAKHPSFQLLFDGMHGAGGPFAERVLVQELGLDKVRRIGVQ
jgi:phosphoglucomutase